MDAVDVAVATVALGAVIYAAITWCAPGTKARTTTTTTTTSISSISSISSGISTHGLGGGSSRLITPAGSSSNLMEDNFVSRLKAKQADMVVFFGSQTGTAEDYSQRLASEARRFGLHAMVADLQDYDMEQLEEIVEVSPCLVLFCVATYGEGEPTDNAQAFHDLLKDRCTSEEEYSRLRLQGLHYAVFGLGNKTYEHFNSEAKFVDSCLTACGAIRLGQLGLGDDDENLEDDFLKWKDDLWPLVCAHFGRDPTAVGTSFRTYALEEPGKMRMDRVFSGEQNTFGSYAVQRRPFSQKNPFLARVQARRELYRDDERSCLHLELNLAESGLRYTSGDHVAVYPCNSPALVHLYATRVGIPLDTVISLKAIESFSKKKSPFPCPCTYRTALTHYLELTHLPNANVLTEFAQYAKDEAEKERLLFLVSRDGRDEFRDFIAGHHRTVLDVLLDFPSVAIPPDHLMELLPRMQPRYYSISSASTVFPDTVHITAAVVRYTSPVQREIEGVATTWLQRLELEKERVPVFVRRSQFRLPSKASVPIIMIGPGTGVAPFRAFVQERMHKQKQGEAVGQTVLFFGCQHAAKHFMYREEFDAAVQADVLTLFTAFSRDQREKIYVQHRLREAAELVWTLLESGAYVYVCGDAKHMAHDVHVALRDIIREKGNKTENQADDYLKALETKRRLQKDVWS